MKQLIEVIVALVAAALLGLVIALAAIRLTRWLNSRRPNPVRSAALRRLIGPTRTAIPLLVMAVALHYLNIGATAKADTLHGIELGLDVAMAWIIARLAEASEDALLSRYHISSADNLKARRLQTQIRVLRRIFVVLVIVVALALALFSFPSVRLAGAGLLASAGIISIIAGIASKPVASNVVAGIQIAISQPIRLDDVVVVENEWGRIEEIALTYVVVRIWDMRRLVLPISYFITTPFENWTRTTSEILGWVHIEIDYLAPVEVIREQFLRILADAPTWDGKVAVCQVTNLGPSAMQLRFLMSSLDSGRSWDLQCLVREKLIQFLQENYPLSLPRIRAEFVNVPDPPIPSR